MAEGYIGDLVARLTADISDFVEKIDEAIALVEAWGDLEETAQIAVDGASRAIVEVTTLADEIRALPDEKTVHLSVDVAVPDLSRFVAGVDGEIRRIMGALPARSSYEFLGMPAMPPSVASMPLPLNAETMAGLRAGTDQSILGSLAALAAVSGGGKKGGGGGGLLAGLAGWGTGSVLGMGWMFNLVHTAHLWVPVLIGLGSALAITAAGFVTLGLAAAPTVNALQQGYTAVDQANNAMNLATPGTQAWAAATAQLGNAWAGIPAVLQPAVRQIYDTIQGGSGAIGQSAQNWVLMLVSRFTSALGKQGPLYSAILNAVNATESAITNQIVNPLLGGGGQGVLARFFNAEARDIGPMLHGLLQLGGAFGHLFAVLAGVGLGGQGLNLLTSFINMLSGILSSPMGHAFLTTMVDIDRYILRIISDVMNLIGAFHGLGPTIGVLLAIAEVAYSWSRLGGMFTKFLVTPIVGGVATILRALGKLTTASSLGDLAAIFKRGGAATAAGAAGEGGAAVGGLAGAFGVSSLVAGATVAAAVAAAAAVAYGIYRATQGTSPNPYTGMAGMTSSQINALASGTIHAGILPSGVTAQAAQATLKMAQAEGISAQAAAKLEAAQWNLSHAVTAVAKATGSSTTAAQYALQVTHGNTQAAAEYVKAQDQIGSHLASLGTGFATFTVGARTSVASMFTNLENQKSTLSTWATDAQILIKRGMSPQAVADLMNTVPQDLGELVNLSGPKLRQLANEFAINMGMSALFAQQGTFAFRQKLLYGIAAINHPLAVQLQGLMHTMYGLNFQLSAAGQQAGFLWGSGLANALRAQVPNVAGAAQQLAYEVARVTKLQHLTASPSRLAYYYGEMWGAGMQLGISSKVGAVRGAAGALALAAMQAPRVAATSAAGGRTTINVHVYGPNAATDHQIGVRVAEGVRTAFNQRAIRGPVLRKGAVAA